VAYLPRDIRARAVGGLRGRVLEVGSGSGPNFPYYRGVNRVVAVEPDPTMRRRAARQVHLLRQQGVRTPIEIVDGRGEQLPFAARSFDAAVLTLVLCSVDDVDAALAEVRRVLRPGASVRMVEHVRAPDPTTAAVQAWMTRLNRRFGGCHLDRDAVGALRWAGFEILDYTEHWNGVLVDVRARTPSASPHPPAPPEHAGSPRPGGRTCRSAARGREERPFGGPGRRTEGRPAASALARLVGLDDGRRACRAGRGGRRAPAAGGADGRQHRMCAPDQDRPAVAPASDDRGGGTARSRTRWHRRRDGAAVGVLPVLAAHPCARWHHPHRVAGPEDLYPGPVLCRLAAAARPHTGPGATGGRNPPPAHLCRWPAVSRGPARCH